MYVHGFTVHNFNQLPAQKERLLRGAAETRLRRKADLA